MKKPKKITVKFFLNEHLKYLEYDPQDKENNKGRPEDYPLYAQITYNRRNTQIKCHYGGYFKSLEEVREKRPHLLAFEEETFRKMMKFEIDKQGDNLEMKGLGKKYQKYSASIHQVFNSFLKARFRSEISIAEPQEFTQVIDYENPHLSFETLFDASQRLFDNMHDVLSEEFKEEMTTFRQYRSLYEKELGSDDYSFPIVMDWLNHLHLEDLHHRLKDVFANDSEKVKAFVSTINRIVLAKLEMVN